MKRLFAAVKINPDEIFLEKYESLRNALHKEQIKWVNPNHIHVTLKFFGETEEKLIPDICNALARSAIGTGIVNMEISKTGIFGSKYDPRVIWFGIQDEGKLNTLHINLRNELIPLGFVPDTQNFVPHLTIARIKEIHNKKHFQEIINSAKEDPIQSTIVKEYHLFESKLFSYGPEYTILKTFSFEY
jgi:RNA 2',3'-cyclic 3'-phosphodiesterase